MGASGTFEDPEQEQQLGIFTQSFSALLKFYTKLLSFIMIFQRSDDTARFRDSGAQHRFRRVLVFSAPRPRLGFVFYILYIPTQTRASLSVGLPVRLFCLFVCLFRSVCFFVSLFFTVRRPRRGFVFYLLYLSTIRCSFRSALASSGRHGERGVQQHPGGHHELPRLCRQEQGVVSIIQEQAARLPVSLQQGRIRSVSRQGPAIIIYSRQHRHRDA